MQGMREILNNCPHCHFDNSSGNGGAAEKWTLCASSYLIALNIIFHYFVTSELINLINTVLCLNMLSLTWSQMVLVLIPAPSLLLAV